MAQVDAGLIHKIAVTNVVSGGTMHMTATATAREDAPADLGQELDLDLVDVVIQDLEAAVVTADPVLLHMLHTTKEADLPLQQDHDQEHQQGAVVQDLDQGLLNKQAVRQAPRKAQVQIKMNNAEITKEFVAVSFSDYLGVGAFSVHSFQSSTEKSILMNSECCWPRKPSPVCKFNFYFVCMKSLNVILFCLSDSF